VSPVGLALTLPASVSIAGFFIPDTRKSADAGPQGASFEISMQGGSFGCRPFSFVLRIGWPADKRALGAFPQSFIPGVQGQ